MNSGEYKLMGLAPYGDPRFAQVIRDYLIDLKPDGSFRMDMTYFQYCEWLRMTSPAFDRLFGGTRRDPESPITQREMDIAASIQQVTEEIMLAAARHVHRETGQRHLCLAGGVALNCVGTGRILREGPFEDVWIQPGAGDAGGTLGIALFLWHQLLGHTRPERPHDHQHGSLLGPTYTDDQLSAFLESHEAVYRRFDDDQSLCDYVAGLLADEQVVGWFQGRMEFGPRALGARSILGDARSATMQSVMNRKIKFRESFRPFAPSVLPERVGDFVDVRPDQASPYMLLVAPVRDAVRTDDTKDTPLHGLDRLQATRSSVPAVPHVYYSARVQTVDPERHGRYHTLLEAFERRTGCPVIINTSFNVRGEPIVCEPVHAYRCFMATNMDALVLERYVLLKRDQPESTESATDDYLAQFALD